MIPKIAGQPMSLEQRARYLAARMVKEGCSLEVAEGLLIRDMENVANKMVEMARTAKQMGRERVVQSFAQW